MAVLELCWQKTGGLAWVAFECGKGRSVLKVLQSGCCRSLINCGRFLVSAQRSWHKVILGYADDINVMLLWIDSSIYVLQLDSLQFTKLWETNVISRNHPYATIYDSGNSLFPFVKNKRNLIEHSTLLPKYIYDATEMLG